IASWFDGWGYDAEKRRIMLVGYGLPLGKSFAVGANIRHHRLNRALRTTQLGWSFDLGVLFSHKLTSLSDQVAVGLTFEDLGGHIWENGRLVEKMPPVTRLGTTYSLNHETTLSADLALHNDKQFDWRDRFRAHLGAEHWFFKQQVGIRIGYTAITTADRFTKGEWSRGFSLRSGAGQLDYAYVSGGELEQGIHWISATLRWGGRGSEEAKERGGEGVSHQPPITNHQPPPITMPQPILSNLSVSEAAISPNGDGIQDLTLFDFDVPEEKAWQLEIRDRYGKVVQTYSGTGMPLTPIQWDGRDTAGNLVRDGTYTTELIYLDADGKRQPQSQRKVTVDTIPPALEISVDPLILAAPDGAQSNDGSGRDRFQTYPSLAVNVPTVHVKTSDRNLIAHWEMTFLDKTGNVIDRMGEDGEPPDTIVWNNWRKRQLPLSPNAEYRYALTVQDVAGNYTTREAALPLIDQRQKDPPMSEKEEKERQEQSASVEDGEEREIVLTLSGVAFDSNSYEIKYEYRASLEKVAQTIAAYPATQVIIAGHTDDVGEASYNLELSFQRANAVMAYLVNAFGIAPSRLSAIGYGEERPIADNSTESGRQQNRRVEIVLKVKGTSRPTESREGRDGADE
ncbi:OmpA family protein, partial [Candidatus Poribacteria bacterium]|nr:OmpA family protein [Candidatus Poribacteria bacterium]